MIRVLQCVNIMDRAGLENMLMNYYRNIDRTQIQFDFLTHREEKGAYDDEIISMGGKVYHAPRLYPQNYPVYFKWMKQFFKEHPEYRIVHSHIDAMSYFPLLAAKKARIPFRIAHSHSSKLDKDIKLPIKYFALKQIPKIANQYFACGKKAGLFMYGNREFTVINNAIDLNKFSFNSEIRKSKRKELGIPDDKFVVGHVGRYCYIKNQLFLLDIFKEVLEINDNSLLILVGNGPDEKKIIDKAKTLGIVDKVQMLKDRDDVNELYQAFDVFIMPSLFEGLPLVGVEAQANGLPCIISDNVSSEVKISSSVKMVSVQKSAKEWANLVVKFKNCRNGKALLELENAGYNVKNEAEKLLHIYKKFMWSVEKRNESE